MKKQIIVLVTGGKNDDVDTVRVVLFDSYSEAVAFCNQTTEADVRKVMVACIRAINPNMYVHMRYMKTN